MLTPRRRRGRPRADGRQTLNGILGVLRSGARWKDLPRRYGSPSTCHRRLQTWQRQGMWEHLWLAFLATLDAQGRLDWSRAFLDGSFVPAKRGAHVAYGWKGSTVHLLTEVQGQPLTLQVTAANVAQVEASLAVVDRVRVPRPRGRPRQRPGALAADKGYDSAAFRRALRRRIRSSIPQGAWPGRRRRPGRPPRVLPVSRERWKVERTHGWLDTWRRLVVRYERHTHVYVAFLTLACVMTALGRILG